MSDHTFFIFEDLNLLQFPRKRIWFESINTPQPAGDFKEYIYGLRNEKKKKNFHMQNNIEKVKQYVKNTNL